MNSYSITVEETTIIIINFIGSKKDIRMIIIHFLGSEKEIHVRMIIIHFSAISGMDFFPEIKIRFNNSRRNQK